MIPTESCDWIRVAISIKVSCVHVIGHVGTIIQKPSHPESSIVLEPEQFITIVTCTCNIHRGIVVEISRRQKCRADVVSNKMLDATCMQLKLSR